MNEEDYLKERLDDQLEWYSKKSQLNQKWFKRLRLVEIISAAIIPFISKENSAWAAMAQKQSNVPKKL